MKTRLPVALTTDRASLDSRRFHGGPEGSREDCDLSGSGRQRSIAIAMRYANQVSSLAFELVIPIGGGMWLDRRYGTSPWLMIAGVLIGSALAALGLRRLMNELDRNRQKSRGQDRSL